MLLRNWSNPVLQVGRDISLHSLPASLLQKPKHPRILHPWSFSPIAPATAYQHQASFTPMRGPCTLCRSLKHHCLLSLLNCHQHHGSLSLMRGSCTLDRCREWPCLPSLLNSPHRHGSLSPMRKCCTLGRSLEHHCLLPLLSLPGHHRNLFLRGP